MEDRLTDRKRRVPLYSFSILDNLRWETKNKVVVQIVKSIHVSMFYPLPITLLPKGSVPSESSCAFLCLGLLSRVVENATSGRGALFSSAAVTTSVAATASLTSSAARTVSSVHTLSLIRS